MKAFLSVLAVPFLLAATASADWVIESNIESAQINSNTTMKVKGDKFRMDIANGPAGAMSTILDTAGGGAIQMMHAQKMAMKLSAAQLKQSLDAASQKAGTGGGTAPKATGQKEKIGDYDCEIYTWANGPTSARLWVAKDHPQAAALKEVEKKMRASFPGAAQGGPDTSALPGAAIKTEITTGAQKMTTTILSVKEQPVDAKEFELPADYQVISMPSLPAGN